MLEGSFFMPRNQVSIEELRCRIMKLKNDAYYDIVEEDSGQRRHLYPGEQELVQKHLSYVLNLLDEYRFWSYNKQVFGARFKPPQMGIPKLGTRLKVSDVYSETFFFWGYEILDEKWYSSSESVFGRNLF